MNIVNLGDCRLVIVNKDGFYNQITTDHKPDDNNKHKAWFRKSDLVPSVGTTIPIRGAFTYSILRKFQV